MTIWTIEELQAYVLKDADDYNDPIFKRSHLMTSPGCSSEEIERLKKTLTEIPSSYIKVIKDVNLNDISIGYFEVSPSPYHPKGMVENIIEGNEGDYLFHEYSKQYNLYLVATTPDYGVFVATSASPFTEGEIILIDESIYIEEEYPERWISRLAKDFEQFLIVAGNLNQIHREIRGDNSNWEEKKAQFIERLRVLGVSEEYHKAWLSVF
jgi:hypothetical protein